MKGMGKHGFEEFSKDGNSEVKERRVYEKLSGEVKVE